MEKKVVVEINDEMQADLFKKAKQKAIICMICSIPFFVAYIFIPDNLLIISNLILLTFSFLIAIPLVIIISQKRIVNKYRKQESFVTATFNLFDDHLESEGVRNGEVVETNKVYYKDLKGVKESKHYYLLLINKSNGFPLLKNQVNPEDILYIKTFIKKDKKK